MRPRRRQLLFRGQVDGIGVRPAPEGRRSRRQAVVAEPDLAGRSASTTTRRRAAMLPSGAAAARRDGGGGARPSRRAWRHATFAAPARVTAGVLASWQRWCRWRRCTSRTIWRRSARSLRCGAATCRRWPASTPRFTAPSRRSRRLSRCPARCTSEGVRRYGFHGLSYEYIASRAAAARARIAAAASIVAHLGNGASLCAVQAGRSVASTMGFTALDGLMMGTRCGALDPGVLLYLMQQQGHDGGGDRGPALSPVRPARRVRHLVGYARHCCANSEPRRARGGRAVLSTVSSARSARWRRRWAASTASSSPPASARTTRRSAPRSPPAAAGSGSSWTRSATRRRARISADASRVPGWVIPTDEERMIARYTNATLTR